MANRGYWKEEVFLQEGLEEDHFKLSYNAAPCLFTTHTVTGFSEVELGQQHRAACVLEAGFTSDINGLPLNKAAVTSRLLISHAAQVTICCPNSTCGGYSVCNFLTTRCHLAQQTNRWIMKEGRCWLDDVVLVFHAVDILYHSISAEVST